MLNLRKFHRYLGVFFTPAILFFAFSGALQTFGLHESERRGEPPPIAWIAAIATVHKDQHLPRPRKTPAAAAAASATGAAPAASAPDAAPTAGVSATSMTGASTPATALAAQPSEAAPAAAPNNAGAAPEAKKKKKSTLPLKLFVLALAIGLCISSLVGITIALANPRSRKGTVIMLVLGSLLPAMLLFM